MNNILFLVNSLVMGGSERKSVNVANELAKRGHSVHLAYLNPPVSLKSALNPEVCSHWLQRSGKISLRAALALRRLIANYEIEIIFCMNLYPLLYAYMSTLMPGGKSIPCVTFVNTSKWFQSEERRIRYIYAPLLRRVSAVVFGCDAQRREWLTAFRLNPSHCEVIYNGVDPAAFQIGPIRAAADELRRQLGLAPDEFVVGCVSALRPEKGHSDVISAVKQINFRKNRVRLLIVGDGPERSRLEHMVKQNNMDEDVIFLGEFFDPRPALAAMDVFVLASTAVETFSNAALESMAMERPTVISDIGGAREMVRHGRTGMIFEPGDSDELARQLSRLLDDSNLRGRLGREGRRQVEESFSQRKMIDRYESICAKLI